MPQTSFCSIFYNGFEGRHPGDASLEHYRGKPKVTVRRRLTIQESKTILEAALSSPRAVLGKLPLHATGMMFPRRQGYALGADLPLTAPLAGRK